MFDNFLFDLIGGFKGYLSSRDQTTLPKGYLVRGSQNVYKKLSGTIANRPGLKQYGPSDSALAGVKASYEWNTSFGQLRPLRVANSKLSVLFGNVWYDLKTALTKTRFVFDTWYEFDESKDRVVMVNGDTNIYHWSGGIAAAGTAGQKLGVVTAVAVSAGGGPGYAAGMVLTLVGGNSDCTVTVVTADGGFNVATVSIKTPGTGYAAGVYTTSSPDNPGGTCTITVTTIANQYTLATANGSTWASNGFASEITSEKSFVANGITYTYQSGAETSTLIDVSPNPSAIGNGTVIYQPVITESNLTAGQSGIISITSNNDFIKMLSGQMFLGSYSSRTVYISAQSQTGLQKGFVDFANVNDLLPGDPDLVVLDSPPTGMTAKEGSMFISAGTSDWYKVTPNVSIPIEIPLGGSKFRLVTTTVEKIPGTGLSAALGHEFIENHSGDIFYVAKDNQLRKLGTIPNMLNVVKFPSISQEMQDELFNEDFTGGHLKAIGEFLYITAPISGRHYMHQTREMVDGNGSIQAERLWHSPQISGISRFAELNGITYGYSNSNPMLYQVWDTNQWHDDSPSGNLSYTSVARMPYTHLGEKAGGRTGSGRFDKVYFEGYISQGTNLYGNVYFDYEGSTDIENIVLNSVLNPLTFYLGTNPVSLGQASLGDNPLGDGLVTLPDDQALLPKFRVICDINPQDSYENQIEVYSTDLDARWELIDLGANLQKSPSQSVEIRKSS